MKTAEEIIKNTNDWLKGRTDDRRHISFTIEEWQILSQEFLNLKLIEASQMVDFEAESKVNYEELTDGC